MGPRTEQRPGRSEIDDARHRALVPDAVKSTIWRKHIIEEGWKLEGHLAVGASTGHSEPKVPLDVLLADGLAYVLEMADEPIAMHRTPSMYWYISDS